MSRRHIYRLYIRTYFLPLMSFQILLIIIYHLEILQNLKLALENWEPFVGEMCDYFAETINTVTKFKKTLDRQNTQQNLNR